MMIKDERWFLRVFLKSSYEQWNFWILSRTGKTTSIEFMYGISHVFSGRGELWNFGRNNCDKKQGRRIIGVLLSVRVSWKGHYGSEGEQKKVPYLFPGSKRYFSGTR